MISTELGYLSGVTSNIQDQLNGKVSNYIIYASSDGSYRDVSDNWNIFANYEFASFSIIRNEFVYGGGGFVYKVGDYGTFLYTDYNSRLYICVYYSGTVYVYNIANNLVDNYGDSLPTYPIGNIFYLKST